MRLLRHNGDPGHRGVCSEVTGRDPVDQHAPLIGQQFTCDQSGEGRLPAAGGPQKGQVGASWNVQVDMVQHGPATKSHRDPFEQKVASDRLTVSPTPSTAQV